MAALSSFKAVEDIWSILTDGLNVWSEKNKQKQNPMKRIEFVFVINEK